MQDVPSQYSLRSNPVFWLMWLLPAAAVAAGFATLAIALRGADRALPPTYHWEGEGLDRDFARTNKAAALGISVALELREGVCIAVVRNPPTTTRTLELELVNGTNAALDRYLTLRRSDDSEFRADCAPLPRGRWWVRVVDTGNDWTLRGRTEGGAARVELRAPAAAARSP